MIDEECDTCAAFADEAGAARLAGNFEQAQELTQKWDRHVEADHVD